MAAALRRRKRPEIAMTKKIESVNAFVVKFANVNGSGSASANELFAKAILRMGVPVSPRNIFPSNIQGLPTWYEVRVSESGWLGRRGGVDLMVAMNPQTWDADVKEIDPGGYLFYDSTKPLPKSKFRDDVNVVGEKIFIEGNAAAALGCVYGGATVCAWYPITPSSSLAEAFQKYCSKLRVDKDTGKNKFAIVQGEDELASIGIAVGAGWNGARAFTATSGPGISLMQEFIGLAYFAEIPVTIIDVQRGGPSTGMPTRTQQSDILACAYASHGDTKHVLLFPEDPHECCEMAAQALDLAERLQTPVFLMTDLDIGMNQRLCKPLVWDDSRRYDRGKVMTAEMLDSGKEFGRYLDVDGDGIPFRTYPGTHPSKGGYFTRGTSKNAYAIYSEQGPDYKANMQRLLKKFETAKTLVPKPVLNASKEPARFGAIYYGSTSPAMAEALDALSRQGIYVNALRLRSFPFQDEIFDFVASHSKVFVIEQNRDAQLKTLLVNDAGINPASLISVLHYDGTPITARYITGEIAEIVAALNVRPLIKKDKAA